MQLRSTMLYPCTCHADALRLPCSLPCRCAKQLPICWASRHQRDGDEIDEFFWLETPASRNPRAKQSPTYAVLYLLGVEAPA